MKNDICIGVDECSMADKNLSITCQNKNRQLLNLLFYKHFRVINKTKKKKQKGLTSGETKTQLFYF